jgi:class 3 adenylate cyclase
MSRQPIVDLPPGVNLLYTLEGHEGRVRSVAFDPQGGTLASGDDDTIKLREASSGMLLRTLKGLGGLVWSVAFDPHGRTLASGGANIKLFEVSSGKLLHTLEGYDVNSVAFDTKGGTLASAGGDGTVRLWDVTSGKLLRTLEGHSNSIWSISYSPQGGTLISGSFDNTIKLWETRSGKELGTLRGHTGVLSVTFDTQGKMIASGGVDGTISLWEAQSGKLVRTLEGHTDHIDRAAFSADGLLLASRSSDSTIRLWNCDTWETVAVISDPTVISDTSTWTPALAFHPTLPRLATAGSKPDSRIYVWELNCDLLLGPGGPTDSVCYKNAKVVLVGDSGVGKSALAMRMTKGEFEPTESTHGRRIWLFDSGEAPLEGGRKQTRETLLWDLAGQPGYRLVHQLNIDEAAVALVLVDARNETDPLGPAEFWSKAIDQARSAVPITKILVEARADRGGVAVSPEDLQRFCERFGFAGLFRTSAKTGLGVAELKQAVCAAIPWDQLPEVISTTLFTQIRDFLQAEKQRGDQVLVEELNRFMERYVQLTGHAVSDAEFRTVVGRLAASGLAQFLIFTVLNEGTATDYVLMQPEYLDAYASAIINQARQDPRGIGHVSEARIRQGDLGLMEDERIPDRWAEELVIGESIEQLLKHDIAMRERLPEDHEEAGDFLVLPSQYTRTSPYPGKKLPGVAYEFEGASRAIFATLVVRLTHHRHFAARDFWRDAACYATVEGWQFIVVLEELSPSRGRLSVYFDNNPPRDEQIAFLRYVEGHLNAKALPGSVAAHRENRCPACSLPWDEAVVQNRLRLGKRDIICPNCEIRSPLLDLLLMDTEPDDGLALQEARLIDADAEAARKRQMAVTAIRGKEHFGEYDVFLSYNSSDRAEVLRIGEMLKGVGIRPWLDVWDLVPGKPWQDQLEQAIDKVRTAAVCVGASGMGPWQDAEMAALLEKFVKRQSPVMPVILRGLTTAPDLPAFLAGFMWVDLRELNDENPRPLANLVAGILGRRPSEMQHDSLAEQVAAILRPGKAAPSVEVSVELPPIILPVSRPELSDDELDAVLQQTAQLLGISSRSVQLVRTERGSVRVVLQLDDMIALSELLLMAQKGDPNLIKFFDRCQISLDEFQAVNASARPKLAELREEEKARQPDELDQKVGKVSPPDGLREWTGGANVATLAIVFTDIVDSTRLCYDLGDASWDGYRQLHFAHTQQLIAKSFGCFIKNTGDGVLAAFHNADDAVTFAQNVVRNTGHAVVRVRAGAHVGQVSIDGGDTFGRHVNLAARVMSCLAHDGVIISDPVKSDLDARRTPALATLAWKERPNISLKGIPQPQTLWELQSVS